MPPSSSTPSAAQRIRSSRHRREPLCALRRWITHRHARTLTHSHTHTLTHSHPLRPQLLPQYQIEHAQQADARGEEHEAVPDINAAIDQEGELWQVKELPE